MQLLCVDEKQICDTATKSWCSCRLSSSPIKFMIMSNCVESIMYMLDLLITSDQCVHVS